MAEIVISIAAKVAEYLVEQAIRQVQYLFCVNKVIKDLENEKKELASERESLQSRKEQAKNRTEIIEEPVEKWMNEVKNLLEEVEDLEQKMQANNSCVRGWSPTWRRYRLCKQILKKTKVMRDFKGSSNIEPFSHRAPLPGMKYIPLENFTYFESTKVAYNQLLETLQDDSVYMIGLYGMGGSGKTTLVTAVGKIAEELKFFDQVILVTVSKTPNNRSIQGNMADMLNMKLEEESEEGRAQRLWLRLKEEKRILIIADDLWEEFNLEDIGIRFDNSYKGRWKVLLTTRRHDICTAMDCQKRIQLGLLYEDEGWTLFQKHAGIDDAFSSKSLNDVPRKLCKECKGLPIAIVAVGSSLKGKSKAEWEVALHSLKHSELIDDHVEKGVRDALSCLKLSYDYLKNKEAELLFLMCSMFPEDHEIFVEDLIRYAFGVGLGRRISLDLARCRIRAGINKLVDSCLLMHSGQSKHHVKMHDMVRDVALWIALRSEDHKILVNLDKPVSTLAEDDGIKHYFAVSMWYEETGQISLHLDAPNPEILLLNTRNLNSFDLSHASFEGIEGLKVMALINKPYSYPSLSLPQSTQLLTNLRTLRLNRWALGDMSFLVSLTRLEILDLQGCSFNELPNEMEKLKRLKLLDLSYCDIRENYNYEAIGKCSQLEELYASGYKIGKDPPTVVDIVTLPNLQRFVIQNGPFGTSNYAGSMRVLNLVFFNISTLGASKKNLLQTAENVILKDLRGGCKNIIPEMVGVMGGMNYLTNLSLQCCEEIECLIDTTCDHVGSLQVDALIPKLVNLELLGLNNLKEVCRGPQLQVLGFFENLEVLDIAVCHHLHSIFPRECNLRNLKSLTIKCCKELKHIITSGGEDGSNTSEEIVPAPRNSHLVMPNLKKLSVDWCTKLEFIFPISLVEGLVQLQEIKIIQALELKYVFGGHEDHSSLQNEIQTSSSLPLLKRVVVDEGHQMHLTSNLKRMELVYLPELIFIWSSPTPSQKLSLQYLQHLKVSRCKKLKSIFPMAVHKSLSELTYLEIQGCEELEEIISESEDLENLSDADLCFPKLRVLKVENCNKLKSLFSVAMVRMLPQLSTLHIFSAAQLEEVFRHGSEDGTVNEMEIVLPNLTKINLYKLPNFVDICQGFKILAVKLQQLHIDECPKTTPILRAIQVTPLPSEQR